MKLLSNKKRKELVTTNPRSVKIRQTYGGPAEVSKMLSPQNWHEHYCDETLAAMLVTYGRETIGDIIRLHLANAFMTLGSDKTDPVTLITVTEAILDCPAEHIRLLTMSNLFGFFDAITQGLQRLYGVSHLSIMRAFQEYAESTYQQQLLWLATKERIEREQLEKEHREGAISWEEYAQQKGIDPATSPLDYANILKSKGG